MLHTAPLLVIGDRYELQRELARGGMGSVWVAIDRKLKRSVAVKVMVPIWAENADAATRFEREAMAVAQLQSPHVVQIFDYGVERDCPYIVMELLEGEDLRQRLQRQERLDLETIGRIVVQSAKALSVAHAAGIIHRDLKPGNIFLARSRDEELVKILDFGVAKVDPKADHDVANKEEQTKAGTLLGTPQYMSPEQARGLGEVDHRTDLWSLAVIAYKALTGRLPFIGQSAADIIVKLCTQEPPLATSLAPDLPKEVDRFFRRALARDLAHRFENAQQMAVAFSRIAPTTFPPQSMPEPLPFIGEAAQNRARAVPELDWEDSWQQPLPVQPVGGAAPSAPLAALSGLDAPTDVSSRPGFAPPDRASDDLAALVALHGTEPSDGIPDPLARPLVAPAPASTGAPADVVITPTSSATLASGLVDVTPSGKAPRKGRPMLFVGLALVALAVGAGALVRQTMSAPPGASPPEPSEHSTAETGLAETGLGGGATPSPAGSSQDTPTAAQTGAPTGEPSESASEAPSAQSTTDTMAPSASTPHRTRPPVPPRRPPAGSAPPTTAAPATPTTADPFSERL